MTINATAPIYNFRQISPLVDRRLTSQSAPERNAIKPQQLDLFDAQPMPARQVDSEVKSHAEAKVEGGRTSSVSDLVDRFFADKIHRHDKDRDGQLNRQEFFGSEEQFVELDEDEDGFVRATDLKKQFLDTNPEMREMAEGFAGKLYDQILNSPSSSPEELHGMVEDFFADLVAKNDTDGDGDLYLDEFPGTEDEFKQIAGSNTQSVSKEDLVESFAINNPDLAELRESLLRLKGIVDKQQAQSRNVDMYT